MHAPITQQKLPDRAAERIAERIAAAKACLFIIVLFE
jgi:hypothetical protein